MNDKQIEEFINQFDVSQLKKDGIFGIYQYGGGPDESYIRANKAGVQLYAIELLKVTIVIEETLLNSTENTISLNIDENWMDMDSTIFIDYIEAIDKQAVFPPQTNIKSSIKDKLIPYGCGITIFILVTALIVGFVTIFEWIFNN